MLTLKVDADGHAVLHEGKPVYLNAEGRDIPLDPPDMYTRLSQDGKTLSELRKRTQDFEEQIKVYEDLDIEAAKSALETVRNIKDGELVAAGKVEEIKAAAKKTADEQVATAQKQIAERLRAAERDRDKFSNLFTSEKIGRVFSDSKFISDKCIIPPPMMQAQFGSRFKVEEGKIVAYDGESKVFSRTKPGEIADPDEALEILVDAYPYRDHILKGSGSSGSGARSGLNAAGQKMMSRKEFDSLPPLQQRKLALEHVQFYD